MLSSSLSITDTYLHVSFSLKLHIENSKVLCNDEKSFYPTEESIYNYSTWMNVQLLQNNGALEVVCKRYITDILTQVATPSFLKFFKNFLLTFFEFWTSIPRMLICSVVHYWYPFLFQQAAIAITSRCTPLWWPIAATKNFPRIFFQ